MQLGKALEDAEIAVPEIGASEVLVRVGACGICHSDAHYRAGISPSILCRSLLGTKSQVGSKLLVNK